jgi:hypothetical protein
MEKKTVRLRLSLNRETLRRMSEPELTEARGGGVQTIRSCHLPFTNCPLCDPGP